MKASPDHLDDLICRHIDGGLSASETAELRDLLTRHPDALDRYIDLITIDADARWSLGVVRSGRPVASIPSAPRNALSGRTTRLRITPIALTLAAALLVSAAAVAIYVFTVSRPLTPVPSESVPVATLIESNGGVIVNDSFAHDGGEYEAGTYATESGSAQFILRSSVTVDLNEQTRLLVHGPMSTELVKGSATFNCPSQAKGFAVRLPDGSRIVDLGTAFRVSIDDTGHASVSVTEGRVHWEATDADADPVLVEVGQSIRIADGKLVDITGVMVVTTHADAPIIDGADITTLPAKPITEPGIKFWTETPLLGQTFAAGDHPGGYTLTALTLKTTSKSIPPHEYEIRIGSIEGDAFELVARRTGKQTASYEAGDYITFRFSPPITLAPNQRYGFDISMTASASDWTDGMPRLATVPAADSPHSEHYRMKPGKEDLNTVRRFGDSNLAFHLDLAPQPPQRRTAPPNGSDTP